MPFAADSVIGERRQSPGDVLGPVDYGLPLPDPQVLAAIDDPRLRPEAMNEILEDLPLRGAYSWGAAFGQNSRTVATALARFTALLSGARAAGGSPFLHVETYLGLRPLSRVVRLISDRPAFGWTAISLERDTPSATAAPRARPTRAPGSWGRPGHPRPVTITELFTGGQLADSKKTLLFNDSVQDAAHRAGFVASRSYSFSLRALLAAILEQAPDRQASLNDLIAEVITRASGLDWLPAVVPPDLQGRPEVDALLAGETSGDSDTGG